MNKLENEIITEQTVGEMIDTLYTLKQERSKIQKQADEIKAKENEIRLKIIDDLQNNNLRGAKGSLASVTIGEKIYPNIVSKEDFFGWAVENNRFDLITKHINQAAFRAMLENEGEIPPGTDVHTEINITSLRKI